MHTDKLSLKSAILININIMMGAGIFINTVELAKRAGFLSCLAYVFVGLLMFPLIYSISSMIRLYPSGGFYAFANNEIHPSAGFISAWSYFIGKLGTAMLLIHTALLLCQQIIPLLAKINVFFLDSVILALFVMLNMFNLRTGRIIQGWLMAIKIVPIVFVLLVGLYCINPVNFVVMPGIYNGLFSTIPLVIYAFLGFEATVSLSSKIENAHKNGPLAIFISYASVIGLYVLYQFLFCAAVGNQLIMQNNYLGAFPTLLTALFGTHSHFFDFLLVALNLSIAASALGGSYGILYSNNWNLYALAENNHLFFSSYFTKTNKHMIPFACVLMEGVIACFYLYMSGGKQVPLQLTSVLGSIIAYTLSVLALFFAWYNKRVITNPWIIVCALINCAILMFACGYSFSLSFIAPLCGFFGLLIFGIVMFFFTFLHKNN